MASRAMGREIDRLCQFHPIRTPSDVIDPSRRLVPLTAPEDHQIQDAAEAGDLPTVRALLDRQPSLVGDINRAGGHALHRAVIGGSAEVVTLLLESWRAYGVMRPRSGR